MTQVIASRAPADMPFTTRERAWWWVSTGALATFYGIFALIHLQIWRDTGNLTGLGIVLQEALVVVLFVVRRRASRTSTSPLAWIATGVGAFLLLALRPGGSPVGGAQLSPVWQGLQVLSAVGYVASLGFLGRSFGVVPAFRGIRTSGPYRWVRHPVYAAYLVGEIGYLLDSPTSWNLLVIAVQTLGQVVRMDHEEAVLSSDPAYVDYRERVRYRLVPGLY
ncbi:MAG: isoprenylcysteine carboxylmethyltransferase family protein [Dehalococcoidia bacterium]